MEIDLIDIGACQGRAAYGCNAEIGGVAGDDGVGCGGEIGESVEAAVVRGDEYCLELPEAEILVDTVYWGRGRPVIASSTMPEIAAVLGVSCCTVWARKSKATRKVILRLRGRDRSWWFYRRLF